MHKTIAEAGALEIRLAKGEPVRQGLILKLLSTRRRIDDRLAAIKP